MQGRSYTQLRMQLAIMILKHCAFINPRNKVMRLTLSTTAQAFKSVQQSQGRLKSATMEMENSRYLAVFQLPNRERLQGKQISYNLFVFLYACFHILATYVATQLNIFAHHWRLAGYFHKHKGAVATAPTYNPDRNFRKVQENRVQLHNVASYAFSGQRLHEAKAP